MYLILIFRIKHVIILNSCCYYELLSIYVNNEYYTEHLLIENLCFPIFSKTKNWKFMSYIKLATIEKYSF